MESPFSPPTSFFLSSSTALPRLTTSILIASPSHDSLALNPVSPLILQYDGSVVSDPLLSKRRLDETLTSGYFDMLGTLSRHPEGVACVQEFLALAFAQPSLTSSRLLCSLLTRFKFFTRFYHLSDLRSREDLIKAIIENLDYTT